MTFAASCRCTLRLGAHFARHGPALGTRPAEFGDEIGGHGRASTSACRQAPGDSGRDRPAHPAAMAEMKRMRTSAAVIRRLPRVQPDIAPRGDITPARAAVSCREAASCREPVNPCRAIGDTGTYSSTGMASRAVSLVNTESIPASLGSPARSAPSICVRIRCSCGLRLMLRPRPGRRCRGIKPRRRPRGSASHDSCDLPAAATGPRQGAGHGDRPASGSGPEITGIM